MAEEVEPVYCGYCSQAVEGYLHERTVVFESRVRSFGPERVLVQPCGCQIDFPEFAYEDAEPESMPANIDEDSQYEVGVVIADATDGKIILEFYDVFDIDELDDEEDEDARDG